MKTECQPQAPPAREIHHLYLRQMKKQQYPFPKEERRDRRICSGWSNETVCTAETRMSLGGALRNVVRSFSSQRILPLTYAIPREVPPLPVAQASSFRSALFLRPPWSSSLGGCFSTSTGGAAFSGLTDTRFPKRRPGTKPRRKRASLKPPGPFAWVQYTPGEPIPRSRPNEGSVQGRKRKKRIKQRKAFILAEKKKRKAQFAEARRKRDIKRIERKMAAVAREKAWAQRLIELQQLEAEKKAAMA